MKRFNLILCLALGTILAGCAGRSTTHYYTLVPVPASGTTVAHQAPQAKKYAISVQTVRVPEQVDRTQIVISESDSARMTPLNESLWSSPLPDEIRQALSVGLSARLGVLDIPASTAPASLPVWKIYVAVDRFDSVFDSRAILDATWRLVAEHGADKQTPRICRAEISIPVASGIPALVQGQRKAVQALAGLIATQLSTHSLPANVSSAITLKGCV